MLLSRLASNETFTMNQNYRQNAKNAIEKDFYKLKKTFTK